MPIELWVETWSKNYWGKLYPVYGHYEAVEFGYCEMIASAYRGGYTFSGSFPATVHDLMTSGI